MQFSPKNIITPTVAMFTGKSNSGKSFLMRSLLYCLTVNEKRFSFGYVYTGSPSNEDYEFIDPTFIIDYTKEKLERYIEFLERTKDKMKKSMPSNFIVFDDLLAKLEGDNKIFMSFLSRHRHYNTTIFISTQYIKGRLTNPMLREAVKYAFMFNSHSEPSVKGLYQSFGQLFHKFADFQAHFWKNTDKKEYPHTALLYIADEDDINKNYFRIKGTPLPKGAIITFTINKKPKIDKEEKEIDIDQEDENKLHSKFDEIVKKIKV